MTPFDDQLRKLERRPGGPKRDAALAALYQRIGQHHSGHTLARWISQLDGDDENQAIVAIDALTTIGPAALRALPAIQASLARLGPRLIPPAVQAFVAIAKDHIPQIAEALRNPEAQVRTVAAQALARIPGADAEAALVAALRDEQACEAVAKVLSSRPIPAAIPALTALLEDGNPSLQYWFYRALDACDHPDALDACEAAIDHKDHTISSRALARFAALPDRDRALRPLITALQSHDPELRFLAAEIFAQDPRPKAEAPLIEALEDPEPWVRCYAARALGEFPTNKARRALQDSSEDLPFVRRAINEALAGMFLAEPP